MDPFTAAFVVKTGFDLVSAFDSGNAKRKQADITRQLTELNKRISDRNAFEYLTKGLSKANAYKSQAEQQISKQNVAYAYADVDTSFGTAQMIQEQSKLNAQFNTKELEEAAYAAALGERQKGLQLSFQGELNAMSMEQQASQMMTSAIIKGATDVGLNWNKLSFDGSPTPSGGTTYDTLMQNIDSTLSFLGGPQKQEPDNFGIQLNTPALAY